MSVHEVVLAARAARLHLNNESCRVLIYAASKTYIFTTAPGIFEHEGVPSVSIPNERIIVPITDITKIEIPVSRFTPDVKSFMTVDWE